MFLSQRKLASRHRFDTLLFEWKITSFRVTAEKIPWAWIFYQFSLAWGKFQSTPLICGATVSEIEIHLGLFFPLFFFTPHPLPFQEECLNGNAGTGNSLGCKMNPDTCHLMGKSSLTAWFLVLQSNICLEPRTTVVPERLPSKADHRDFFLGPA